MKNKEIYVSLFGVLLSFLLFVALSNTPLSPRLIYVVGGLFFAAVFGIIMLFVERYAKKQTLWIRPGVYALIDFWVLFACIGWICGAFLSEIYERGYDTAHYPRHNMPAIVYFGLLIFLLIFTIAILRSFHYSLFSFEKYRRGIRVCTSIVLASLCTWLAYIPNIFAGGEGTNVNLYHLDAYATSIVNTSRFIPYTAYTTPIYGHYGIFYIIPVKFLHLFLPNRWCAISMAISLVVGITILFSGLILGKVIKNDMIFILASLALCVPSVQMTGGYLWTEVYYQILPNRMLFPAITLYGCLVVLDTLSGKSKRKWNVCLCEGAMWLIVSFGILWNLESGLCCLIVWAFCELYVVYSKRGLVTFKNMIEICGLSFMSIVVAYAIFNVYNVLCGASFQSIGVFLHPLLNQTVLNQGEVMNESFVNIISSTRIMSPFSGWFFAFGISISVFCIGIYRIIKGQIDEHLIFVVLTSIMTLGLLIFIVSFSQIVKRSLISLEIIVLISSFCDYDFGEDSLRIFAKGKPNIRGIAITISIFMLLVMAAGTIGSLSDRCSSTMNTAKNTFGIEEFAKHVSNHIPEDTIAFGMGVPELFAYMDREPGLYIMDFPDFFPAGAEYLVGDIESRQPQYLFVSADCNTYVPNIYELIEQFDYLDKGTYVYELYRRVD